jgi:hypothetical protein
MFREGRANEKRKKDRKEGLTQWLTSSTFAQADRGIGLQQPHLTTLFVVKTV